MIDQEEKNQQSWELNDLRLFHKTKPHALQITIT